MAEKNPLLEVRVEQGIPLLTILRKQIEGEEISAGLKEELTQAVAQTGCTKVVLDLSATRYVSSIAFWPLLALRRQLAEKQGRLILCGLSGAVYDVFTTTKTVSSSGATNAPFELANNRDAAIEKLLAS